MARTTLSDLHSTLFEAMQLTLHPEDDHPFTAEQAGTLVSLAQTVIQAGRAEVEYVRAIASLNPGGLPHGQQVKSSLFLTNGVPTTGE